MPTRKAKSKKRVYVRRRTAVNKNTNTLTNRVSVRLGGTTGLPVGAAALAATSGGGGGGAAPIVIHNTLPDTVLQRLTRIEEGLARPVAAAADPLPARPMVADASTNTVAFVSDDAAPVSTRAAGTQTRTRTRNRGVQFAPATANAGTTAAPGMQTQGTQMDSSTQSSGTQTRTSTRTQQSQAGTSMMSTGVSTATGTAETPALTGGDASMSDANSGAWVNTGTPSGAIIPSLPGHPAQPAYFVNGPRYTFTQADNDRLLRRLTAPMNAPATGIGSVNASGEVRRPVKRKAGMMLPALLSEAQTASGTQRLPSIPATSESGPTPSGNLPMLEAGPPAPVNIRPTAFGERSQPVRKKARMTVAAESDVLGMAKKTARLLKSYGKPTAGIDKLVKDLLTNKISKAQAKPLVKEYRRAARGAITGGVKAGTPAPAGFSFDGA